MCVTRPALLVFLSIWLASVPTGAQQQTPQRDPQAYLVATQAIQALGGNSADISSIAILANAQIVFHAPGEGSGALTVKALGLDRVRQELTVGGRTTTTVLKGRHAGVQKAGGSPNISLPATAPFRANYIPLLSPLSDVLQADTQLAYLGIDTVSQVRAHHIVIRREGPKPIMQRFLEAFDFHVFVDTQTLLPVKVIYFALSVRSQKPPSRIEDTYSDYRHVAQLLVPFSVERSLNGKPYASFTFQQVTQVASFLDSEFDLM